MAAAGLHGNKGSPPIRRMRCMNSQLLGGWAPHLTSVSLGQVRLLHAGFHAQNALLGRGRQHKGHLGPPHGCQCHM